MPFESCAGKATVFPFLCKQLSLCQSHYLGPPRILISLGRGRQGIVQFQKSAFFVINRMNHRYHTCSSVAEVLLAIARGDVGAVPGVGLADCGPALADRIRSKQLPRCWPPEEVKGAGSENEYSGVECS